MYKLINFLKKIKLPSFVKRKFFLFVLFFVVLFLFFTPISLIQVGKKVEAFINEKAKSGVIKFQKQTGLLIHWEELYFNIFTLRVHLKGVKISHSPSFGSQKIEELKFLEGSQEIRKILVRPSIFSLLFEKKIFLSKVHIKEGNIYLKTVSAVRSNQIDELDSFQLPIKKIIIEDSYVTLRHKNHVLTFSQIKSYLLQKEDRTFNFNIFIEAFSIDQNLGGASNEPFSHYFLPELKKDRVYEVSTKGVIKPGQLFFSYLNIKNDFFKSDTNFLDIYFNSKGVSAFSAKSSGALPLFFIQSALSLIDRHYVLSDSYMNYDLNFSYEKRKGSQGRFNFSVEDVLFKSTVLKKINIKGRLQGFLLLLDEGFIDTKEYGGFVIKKAEWVFLKDKPYFNLTFQNKRLSLDFITEKLFDQPAFPVKGDLTGLLDCKGSYALIKNIVCEFKGSSQKLELKPEKSQEIFSVYNFDLDFKILLKNKAVTFQLEAEKEQAGLLVNGKYEIDSDELSASYSFRGDVYNDIKINAPIDLKGKAIIRRGAVSIKKNKLDVSGFLSSSSLKLDNYNLENIAASYRFSDNKLVFYDIKGSPGKTRYSGKVELDFIKDNLDIQLNSNLFHVKDFVNFVKHHFHPPFELGGTGTFSLSFNSFWSDPSKKEFDLKGSFFNIVINTDFFNQAQFHFTFKKNQGLVQSLFLKKIHGSLNGSGVFNKDYALDIDLDIADIPLESFNFLNDILAFNQTGDMNGKFKMTGDLKDPLIRGSLSISNAFLYSYPIKESRLQVKINKDMLFLEGNFSEEFKINEFFYVFGKDSKIKMKGYFNKLDVIAYLFSKDKKNKNQDYSSLLMGGFDLEKDKFWKGSIKIDQLSIFEINKSLEAKEPFSIFFEREKWFLTPSWFSDNSGRIFNIKKKEADHLLLSGSADLSFFSALFPFMEKMGGILDGKILINNNLKDMQAKGSFTIEDGIFKVPLLPEFTNIKTNMIFSKNNLYINDLKGFSGGGRVMGLGAVSQLFRKDPDLDLSLSFDNIHLQIPEGINSKGSGRIQIKGSQIPYVISGNYDVESGSIVSEFSSSSQRGYDFDLLEKKDEETQSFFDLDLKLNVKNPIQINSSLIRSSIEGEAVVFGPFNSLIMNGKFNLSKGLKQNLFFFRGQEFKINSGSISFFNSKPENPYIDISAQSVFKERLIDPFEKEYSIFLFAKGWAENLDFSLRSLPVLNKKEIISLLTLRGSSRHFDSNNQDVVPDYSYQILASLFLEKPLNREIKDMLGLDFRLTPYINFLNKPVTKVTLSKTWSERWKASLSRTIDFSRAIEDSYGDIRVKYNISPRVSLTAFLENNDKESLLDREEDWLGLDFEFNFDF